MIKLNETGTALVDNEGRILSNWYDDTPIIFGYKCDLEHLKSCLSLQDIEYGDYRMVRVKLMEITENNTEIPITDMNQR